MKTLKFNYSILIALISILIMAVSCEPTKIGELKLATYPTTADVFINGFSAGLQYAAFGTSKVTAFSVDSTVTFNSMPSMKFAVPDNGDPMGSYAGGVFYTPMGRDLSGYNVLSFWAKASQPANLDLIGFGNDLGASTYQTTLSGLAVNSNWNQYYIPIPNPALLTQEKGLLFYSVTPENGRGFTFWINAVKYENLGTISHGTFGINNGRDSIINQAETGDINNISSFNATYNLPTGVNQTENISSAYFSFTSSNPTVAAVNNTGTINVLNSGSTVITAQVGSTNANGSFTINSIGKPIEPTTLPPTPTANSANVISLFGSTYTNVNVDFWNGHWQYSTAVNSTIQVDGNSVMRYKDLNFVGIQFSTPTINASSMAYLHMDIWTSDATSSASTFSVEIVDFGANGVYGGGDDSNYTYTINGSALTSQNWISLNIPLSGLTSDAHLAQLVLSGNLPDIFVDNVYFFNLGTAPTTAAPTPTYSAANVISIFGNSYTNVAGTDFDPNWGQATAVSQVSIAGSNTLKYTGLTYQGTQLAGPPYVNVSALKYLHIDYWSGNSTALNVFLISPGPVQTSYSLSVPSLGGWTSVDIPLSSFAPVDLTNVFQLMFAGNGDIFIGNIFFHQ